MTSISTTRATLDDLYRTEGKAELVRGSIVRMASGHLPSRVAGDIFISLRMFTKSSGRGEAYADGIGYTVPELPSGRESFSPDASYYAGNLPANQMRFIEGPPTLAVAVRSENDYGDVAEEALTAKRADYFAAGTLVVWDLDPEAETVAVYQAVAPTQAIIYRRGDIAEAEPAVPGWRMNVNVRARRIASLTRGVCEKWGTPTTRGKPCPASKGEQPADPRDQQASQGVVMFLDCLPGCSGLGRSRLTSTQPLVRQPGQQLFFRWFLTQGE